ncbi:Thiamine biosynthesis lipoprotein ApbE precursor [Planctomycetes bacterium MalM25]|nr:Thiamine biosynthesis lipoprotein ApbE precursor [Planctomycetes bacterium MalM25]
MGTSYSVTLVGGTRSEADQEKRAIDERLALLNKRMSTYDPKSELSRFNASDSTGWFEVSAETASVVASALDLAGSTEGAYDPTVGPLVNLWGFGPGKRRTRPPSEDEISSVKESVGYSSIDTRLDPPALIKANPAVQIDLSSIAKGHGSDVIAELLTAAGYEAFMIEIGGEVRTRKTKPGGLPWRIGLEKAPHEADGGRLQIQSVVELTDHSLATSGDYRNYFEHEGVRYSHTIDPTTGRPVTHAGATVTVLADTCREADGLATALLVLGPVAGYDWAIEQEIAAYFVSREPDGSLTPKPTPNWRRLTSPEVTR